jgi:hypothetical protein
MACNYDYGVDEYGRPCGSGDPNGGPAGSYNPPPSSGGSGGTNSPGGSPNFSESGTPKVQKVSGASAPQNALKSRLGNLYDDSIGDDFVRNRSYAQNSGKSDDDIINEIVSRNAPRANNAPGNSNSGSTSASGAPTGVSSPNANSNYPKYTPYNFPRYTLPTYTPPKLAYFGSAPPGVGQQQQQIRQVLDGPSSAPQAQPKAAGTYYPRYQMPSMNADQQSAYNAAKAAGFSDYAIQHFMANNGGPEDLLRWQSALDANQDPYFGGHAGPNTERLVNATADRGNTPEQEAFIRNLNTHGALKAGSGFDAHFRPGESNDQFSARLQAFLNGQPDPGAPPTVATQRDYHGDPLPLPTGQPQLDYHGDPLPGNQNYAGGSPNFDESAGANVGPLQLQRTGSQLPAPSAGGDSSGVPVVPFGGPVRNNIDDLNARLVQQVLEHPETLTPEAINAMREKSKEDALTYQQQQKNIIGSDAAARGVFGGGNQNAQETNLAADTIKNLIAGNRQIDLNKVAQDRSDQLGAADLADKYLSGSLGRALDEFNTNQKTTIAQSALDQAGVESQIRNLLNQQDQDARQADEHRFDYGTQVGGANYGLDLQRFLEGIRQFNSNLGYNYTALQNNSQAALIAALLNG